MSRLFAYMGNDPARVACALHSGRKLLVANADESAAPFDSWGIGFYQGEVLLQRRPKAPVEPVDFYALSKDLRTDVIIGHVRSGTVGKPKNENTHPFRFRSWLFAHHGTVPQFQERVREPLLAAVPDFLRRNIRGQTDSEHLFHLLLGHLHHAGRLDDGHVPTMVVREALRATFAQIESWIGEEEARAQECALAVTNGRILLATRHGRPVQLMRLESVIDCPVCRESTPPAGKPAKRVDHEHLRAVTLVADAPAVAGSPWQEIPDQSFVAVAHDLSVEITKMRGAASTA
jgi:glutamine amidotransferase